MPKEDAERINARIGGTRTPQGQYMVECELLPTLPRLALTFGGRALELEAQDYILKVGGGPFGGKEACISGFMGLDIGLPIWIVGDVFLRRWYSIYDLAEGRVGFAQAV
jgi:saccharopepsin